MSLNPPIANPPTVPAAPCPWGIGRCDRRQAAKLLGVSYTCLRDWNCKGVGPQGCPDPKPVGMLNRRNIYDVQSLWKWAAQYMTETAGTSPRTQRQPRRAAAYVATTDAATVRRAAARGVRWTVGIIQTTHGKPTAVWLLPTDEYHVPSDPPEPGSVPQVRARLPNRKNRRLTTNQNAKSGPTSGIVEPNARTPNANAA